jgi:hypothetical protein
MSTVHINKSIAGIEVPPGEYEVIQNQDASIITFVRKGAGSTAGSATNTGYRSNSGGYSGGGYVRKTGGGGKFLSNEEKVALAKANIGMLNEFERSFIDSADKALAGGRRLSDKQFKTLSGIAFKISKGGDNRPQQGNPVPMDNMPPPPPADAL